MLSYQRNQPLQQAQPRRSDQSSNLILTSQIASSSYQTYLGKSLNTGKNYAVKAFPYNKGIQDPAFLREVRTLQMSHPNLIKTLKVEDNIKIRYNNLVQTGSIVIRELAPFGSIQDFAASGRIANDDKLIRTFMLQLFDGLEYLHKQGIFHLDLKPANLLIGRDYSLKIADFDTSFRYGDEKVCSRGTKNFRAPEVRSRKIAKFDKADVYSAGILIFYLKTGMLPYDEEDLVGEHDMVNLMRKDMDGFWDAQKEVNPRFYSLDDVNFQELFQGMTEANPEKRWSIQQIRKSAWFDWSSYKATDMKDAIKDLVIQKFD